MGLLRHPARRKSRRSSVGQTSTRHYAARSGMWWWSLPCSRVRSARQYVHRRGNRAPRNIPALILERNLYGIDIDARAIQLAALALYLKGCEMSGPDFQPRRLNLISTDIALPLGKPPAEYMQRFKGDREMEATRDRNLGRPRDAPTVRFAPSSRTCNRRRSHNARRERDRGGFFEHEDSEWERWKTDLLTGLRDEFEQQAGIEDLGQHLFGEQATKGVSLVEAVSRRYDVVVTNPPTRAVDLLKILRNSSDENTTLVKDHSMQHFFFGVYSLRKPTALWGW